jgi:hypothetical protein
MDLIPANPDMALSKCRVILEEVLARRHRALLGDPGKRMLEQLIRDLTAKGFLPRKVKALCEVVRELGNTGAHPILDDEKVTHREAQVALLSLMTILEWHGRQTDTPERREGSPVPPEPAPRSEAGAGQ